VTLPKESELSMPLLALWSLHVLILLARNKIQAVLPFSAEIY
jgi:hypothetical protein